MNGTELIAHPLWFNIFHGWPNWALFFFIVMFTDLEKITEENTTLALTEDSLKLSAHSRIRDIFKNNFIESEFLISP